MLKFKQLETLNQCLVDWNVNYSVYPYNGYTINEVLMQFYDAINKGIITINEYTNLINAVLDWVKKEGLQQEVSNKLKEWLDDGTLANLINEQLLGDIIKNIDSIETNLDKLKYKGTIYATDFGVKGDGVTDDTKALQDALIYCYKHKKRLYLNFEKALISKPILIIADSNELESSIIVEGNGTEVTKLICSENFTVHKDEGLLNTNACMLIVNESFLGVEGFKNGEGSTHCVELKNFSCICKYNNVEYGIIPLCTNANSEYRNLRLRGFTKKGFANNKKNFYLNVVHKIRVDLSPISFDFMGGINTSCKFDSCYSTGATDTAYKISGVYMSSINLCADGCLGTVYDLTGYRGSLVNLGSESDKATCIIRAGQYTNAEILGGLTYGNYDNINAIALENNSGGSIILRGHYLAFDKTETHRALPGYLTKRGISSYIVFDNAFLPPSWKKDDSNKAYNQYQLTIDREGSYNSRNMQDLNFIGHTTDSNTNAIYMGCSYNPGYLADETDLRYLKPARKGDLMLTKNPETNLSVGFINIEPGSGFYSGGAKWKSIPYVTSLTKEEIMSLDKSKIENGTCVFNTTEGKPVWKKNNGEWVYSDGTTLR